MAQLRRRYIRGQTAPSDVDPTIRERDRERYRAQVRRLITVELLTADFLAAAAVAAGAARAGGVGAADAVELVGKAPADLARLLDERAARAQHVDEHVHQHAAGDGALVAQAPAHDRAEVESEQRQQAVQEAVLADALGVLSHRVARTQVGQKAQLHVAETAEQAELPVGAARLTRRHHVTGAAAAAADCVSWYSS